MRERGDPMETIKEGMLRSMKQREETGQIPKLSGAQWKRVEEQIEVTLEEMGRILDDTRLSDFACLQRLGDFLRARYPQADRPLGKRLRRCRRRALARWRRKRGGRRRKRFR